MHIVTGSDENYVIGVLVLIASVFRHNPSARFSVLTTHWSDNSFACLDRLSRVLGCRIDCVEVDVALVEGLHESRPHLTKATYARLMIPDLMPDAGRVIYMDCDMVVTGALDNAWNAPLCSDYPLAAVPCPAPTHKRLRELDLQAGAYFNAGLLVFDVKNWRDCGFGKTCLGHVAAASRPEISCDETALNELFRGRYLKLDPGYNLYAYDRMYQAPLDFPESIRNIHYVTNLKPWIAGSAFAGIWQSEADRISAYFPDVFARAFRPRSFREKLSSFNRIRKAWMGRLAGVPKYRNQARIRRYIHETMVPGYARSGSFRDVEPPCPPLG